VFGSKPTRQRYPRYAAQHCDRRNHKVRKEGVEEKDIAKMDSVVVCPTVRLFDTDRKQGGISHQGLGDA
jgi:hypothetical protein